MAAGTGRIANALVRNRQHILTWPAFMRPATLARLSDLTEQDLRFLADYHDGIVAETLAELERRRVVI